MFKSFKKNTDGNVAMMFSVSAVMLLIGIGAAVDFGSAASRKQNLQDMVDAATLAAAKSNITNKAELEAIAAKVVAEHNENNYDITLDVTVVGDEVRISGRTVYNTQIMGFVGKPQVDVGVSAASPISALTPIKIALVLDTTESMSGTDIAALKAGTNGLLDELDDFKAPVAVSVVPFGQYVNVGVKRKGSNWLEISDKDGTSETKEVCFEERRTITPRSCSNTGRTIKYRDVRDGRDFGEKERAERKCTGAVTEPTGKEICEMRTVSYEWHGCVGSRQAPYNLQAEFGLNRIEGVLNKTCGAELQELTTSFSQARSTIGTLATSGNTYLPSGVMWGWRTLQDKDPLTTKVNMQQANRRNIEPAKVMVFMTDGANTLTQGGSEPHRHEGGTGPEADKKTLAICEAAKKDGVQIYTIGYRMAEAVGDAKSVLLECASSEAHYRDAANANELKKVFKDLAGQLDFSRLSM